MVTHRATKCKYLVAHENIWFGLLEFWSLNGVVLAKGGYTIDF